MRDRLKEFNVESVCQQINKYVYEHITKKIIYDNNNGDQEDTYQYLKDLKSNLLFYLHYYLRF